MLRYVEYEVVPISGIMFNNVEKHIYIIPAKHSYHII